MSTFDRCPNCGEDTFDTDKGFCECQEVKQTTLAEIKDDADMAETFPDSGVLNWGEIGFKTLTAWVEHFNFSGIDRTENFDVESVKGMFEQWWKGTK